MRWHHGLACLLACLLSCFLALLSLLAWLVLFRARASATSGTH